MFGLRVGEAVRGGIVPTDRPADWQKVRFACGVRMRERIRTKGADRVEESLRKVPSAESDGRENDDHDYE